MRAKQIVRSMVAGNVTEAISFRSIGSSQIFITAVVEDKPGLIGSRVVVLEQVGQAYRETFRSEQLYGLEQPAIQVIDLSNNGEIAIAFESKSYGSAAGSRTLYIFLPERAQALSVTEYLHWADRAGPNDPVIEFSGAFDPILQKMFNAYAVSRGYLQEPQPVDYDDPKYADRLWHAQNGEFPTPDKPIKIRLYQGKYPHHIENSTVLEYDTEEILWVSIFKGALIAYDKAQDRYYIAYSPSWEYRWVNCMLYDRGVLWFGTHMGEGLYLFNPKKLTLRRYGSFAGSMLPAINKIDLGDEGLILNESIALPYQELTHLELWQPPREPIE